MLAFHQKRSVFLASFIFCLALFPQFAPAQANFNAQLRGTVLDSSGAVVPAAGIEIANEATGVTAKTVSDGSGRYIFNAEFSRPTVAVLITS